MAGTIFGATGQKMVSELPKAVISVQGTRRFSVITSRGTFHISHLDDIRSEAFIATYGEAITTASQSSPIYIDGFVATNKPVWTAVSNTTIPPYPDCLRNAEGNYAAAGVDISNRRIWFLRDQWGTKAVYFVKDERGVAFSSDIRFLIPLLGNNPRSHAESVMKYLVRGQANIEGHTFFDGILQLRRGHIAYVDMHTAAIATELFHEQITLPSINPDISFEEASTTLRSHFMDSLKTHSTTGDRIGATLSGGVDSSAVVAGLRKLHLHKPLQTYGYVVSEVPKFDERKWMEMVNTATGADGHYVDVTGSTFFSELPTAAKLLAEPIAGASHFAQFQIYRTAAEHGIHTMLNGVEADGVFGGHSYYLLSRLQGIFRSRNPKELLSFVRGMNRSSTSSGLKPMLFAAVGYLPESLQSRLLATAGKSGVPVWLDLSWAKTNNIQHMPLSLPIGPRAYHQHVIDVLDDDRHMRYAERCGLATGIESRVPMLSRTMIDFVLSLPEQYSVSPTADPKHLFRASLRGLVPDSVLDRTDKIGFRTPIERWLENHPVEVQGYWNTINDLSLPIRSDALDRLSPNEQNRLILFVEWCKQYNVSMY